MVHGEKAPTKRSNWRKLSVFFLCLMKMSTSVVPVTGFALKTCRISNKVAICVKSELSAVPHDLPSTVKGLDLSTNKISRIHVSDFKNLSVLAQLYLDKNYISQIGKNAFSSLTYLKELDLNNNKLVELGDGLFDGLSNLTKLFLSRNKIRTVASTAFKSLASLKVLDISHNKLHHVTNLHWILQHLPHLQQLNIRSNDITIFQSWELTNSSLGLRFLDASLNPITVFRITADVFLNLTWLKIGDSPTKQQIIWDVHNKTFLSRVSTLNISGLQMAFDDMKTVLQSVNTSLKSLRMNAMKHSLTALLSISCTVPTMSTLQLRNNRLRSIRSDMFDMCADVTELDIAENLIKEIHNNTFRPLHSLRILSLSRNRLSSVPAAIRNLSVLKELDLSTNNITGLGCDDFANHVMLTQLSLHQNSISALKDCVFKDLIRLQVLRLETNRLSKLDNAFKKYLPNLRELHLNGNRFSRIPNGEFKGLRCLKILSLHDNQIQDLEKGCFTGLTNLTEILLQKNRITEREVNQGVFNDLIYLNRLDLRENRIKYESSSPLPEPPFSQLSRLQTLAIPSQHRREKARLPCNFLQGLSALLTFNMRNIQLISLHKDMFKYTPRLQTLDISSNELRYLTSELFSPIPNLQSLYISRTHLRSLDFLIHANLTRLEFLQARANQYSVISEETIDSVPALVYVDFQGNTFTCDCDNIHFLNWVESNKQTQVFDAYNFVCNYPPDLNGKKLLDLDVKSCLVDIEFVCFLSTTCAVVLFTVVSFTYHFLRWQLVYAYYLFLALLVDSKHKNKQNTHLYDAFISYNNHDEPWVIGELLSKLEEEQGWKLCLHHRDFEPGKAIIDNITDAIYGSRKTICVISCKYLESEWCSREIQVASFRLFDERKDVLILVFLEEVSASLLSPYYRMRKLLKRKTYLSWPHAGEHTGLFWEKLGRALQTGEDLDDDQLRLTTVDRT